MVENKMKFSAFLEICVLMSFVLAVCGEKDYKNYKIYDVTPSNQEKTQALFKWRFEDGIDFLTTQNVGRSSKILVSPEKEENFLKFLEEKKILFDLMVDDVGLDLQKQKIVRNSVNVKRKLADLSSPDFEHYFKFEEMEEFSIELAQQYPNLVNREVIGKSIEGRDIFALKISSGSQEFGKKPIIFMDAGTHAREWVGPHTVLYFLHQLVTNATVNAELTDKVDWVIIPNVNPDGYVYTHTEDRFWRKNRRVVNYTCTGVDLNRNYGYVWRYVPGSCTTSNYPGAHSLSEPEISAVANYMKSFKHNLRMYLAVHSAGPLMLWPFGYAFDAYVKNWKEHHHVGKLWADAVFQSTGTVYEVGNSADILYTAFGASDDYALSEANADLAYTIELPPSDYNWHDYPQDMVGDLARGTFYGYRALGLYVGENYNFD